MECPHLKECIKLYNECNEGLFCQGCWLFKIFEERDSLKKHHKEIWNIVDEARCFRTEVSRENLLKIMEWVK